jgi:saccharopine dehydrogenase-like NADP-dependent oxidoreductase
MRETTGCTGPDLMIYGATGYTGRLASQYAKYLGLNVVLAGRSDAKMKKLCSELDLSCGVFDLESDETDLIWLPSLKVVLNCAGPFLHTAKPLMEKCIKHRVHYLDISAALDSGVAGPESTGGVRNATTRMRRQRCNAGLFDARCSGPQRQSKANKDRRRLARRWNNVARIRIRR